jgi:hypothetical protein
MLVCNDISIDLLQNANAVELRCNMLNSNNKCHKVTGGGRSCWLSNGKESAFYAIEYKVNNAIFRS